MEVVIPHTWKKKLIGKNDVKQFHVEESAGCTKSANDISDPLSSLLPLPSSCSHLLSSSLFLAPPTSLFVSHFPFLSSVSHHLTVPLSIICFFFSPSSNSRYFSRLSFLLSCIFLCPLLQFPSLHLISPFSLFLHVLSNSSFPSYQYFFFSVYSRRLFFRYRITIAGKTCVFQKQNDPSKLRFVMIVNRGYPWQAKQSLPFKQLGLKNSTSGVLDSWSTNQPSEWNEWKKTKKLGNV